MPNLRFLPKPRKISIEELAKICGAYIQGDVNKDESISCVETLKAAKKGDLAFYSNKKYKEDFIRTQASVCVVGEDDIDYAPSGLALLVSKNPYAAYAILAASIFDGYLNDAFEDEMVSKYAKIGKNCKIAKNCEIAAGAEIGDNVIIHNFVRIGPKVKIGSGTVVKSGCNISNAIVGSNCLFHPGVMIGQDGFGFAPSDRGILKVPQLGGVKIGNEVEIGANSTIDRGALEDTEIGDFTKLDNLVQIGHNVKVGKFCFFAAQVGIAGSTEVGDQVMMGGQSGSNGHIKIGSNVKVAGQSGVLSNVEDGAVIGGSPAMNMRTWHKINLKLRRLVEKKG